jgi:hypothetical protein
MIGKILKTSVFFALIFFGSITSLHAGLSERYVTEIVDSFAREIEKEYGLTCQASGRRMPRGVEIIKVRFTADRRATVDEARELLVQVRESLVQRVNSHEKIRPFLREYPFTSDKVDIKITFHKPDNTYYSDGSVTGVRSASRGKMIAYEGIEPQKSVIFGTIDVVKNIVIPDKLVQEDVFVQLLREPYQEALYLTQGKSKEATTVAAKAER